MKVGDQLVLVTYIRARSGQGFILPAFLATQVIALPKNLAKQNPSSPTKNYTGTRTFSHLMSSNLGARANSGTHHEEPRAKQHKQ